MALSERAKEKTEGPAEGRVGSVANGEEDDDEEEEGDEEDEGVKSLATLCTR